MSPRNTSTSTNKLRPGRVTRPGGRSRTRPVPPAVPIARWVGGKRILSRLIIERIEAIPHDCYAEPFVGMGGVFLRRCQRPQKEIINDLSGDIVNLFRVLREHPDEMARQFAWSVAARHEFERLAAVPPDLLTDIQRAARFAYLQSLSFAGKATGRTMLTPRGETVDRMLRRIAGAHARLQGVLVERMEWDAFIRRYDRPRTLFYLDPPYWGYETLYGKGMFARDHFDRMAEILRGLQGRFILSLNDVPEVRETFAGFQIEPVGVRYTANMRTARRPTTELLIQGPQEKEGRHHDVR